MTVNEYNKCVDLHADGVYRFILKNIRDEEMARDVVQDAFEKVWKKAREIKFEKARSYLFTTAYHVMIDYIRKEKYNGDAKSLETIEQQDEPVAAFNLKEVLDEALERLPDIQRSVLLLRDYEGYSYQEIGDITGCSETQVKVYIYRARLAMKNYLVKMENVI